MGLLGGRLRRLAVVSLDERLAGVLADLYRALSTIGGRYVFLCRRGRCWSYIEAPAGLEAAVSVPGLVLEECRGTCRESSVLLPPPPAAVPPRPPKDLPREGLLLGFSGGEAVRLPWRSLWGHIGVLGATGSGKTHTAARLTRCAAEHGAAVLVLDWHNEYHRLLDGARLLSHPLLPRVSLLGGLGPEEALSAFEDVLGLTPNQALFLSNILAAAATGDPGEAAKVLEPILGRTGEAARAASLTARASSLEDLLSAVLAAYQARSLMGMGKGEQEVWAALIRKLALLGADKRYSTLFSLRGAGELPLEEGKAVILNLASIANVVVRRLYALFLLHSLYSQAQAGTLPPTLVVVEEAHNLLAGNTIPLLLSEARKYMLGLIVVTHTPRILPPQAYANINTIIVHRIVSPEDKKRLAEILPGGYDQLLPVLPPGFALVHAPEWSQPAVAAVELDAPCT